MENEQEAQQAIRSLNGHILNGNRINVEVCTSFSLDHIATVSFFVVICGLSSVTQLGQNFLYYVEKCELIFAYCVRVHE